MRGPVHGPVSQQRVRRRSPPPSIGWVAEPCSPGVVVIIVGFAARSWGRTPSSPSRWPERERPGVGGEPLFFAVVVALGVGACDRLQPRADLVARPPSPTPVGCGTTSRAEPPARSTPTPAPTSRPSPKGAYRDAYLIARAPNPFASICGRVCAAPCESACRRGTVDAPVAIRALKRFVTERFGVESFAANTSGTRRTAPYRRRRWRRSAWSVVDRPASPRPTSCAWPAIPVTVYEAADRLGGMMVLGIPEYRLARGIITREIDAILELGIDVELSCRVGHDVTLDGPAGPPRRRCSSPSAPGRGRDLDLPGHELDGVLRAVEFLLNVNRGFKVDLGRRVVVVGGGNVAFDAARTALRAAAGESASRAAARRRPRAGDRHAGRCPARDDHDARRGPRRGAGRRARRDRHRARVARGDPGRPGGDRRGRSRRHHDPVPHGTAPLRRRATDASPGSRRSTCESVFDDDHRFNPTFVPGTRGGPRRRHRDPGRRPGRRSRRCSPTSISS